MHNDLWFDDRRDRPGWCSVQGARSFRDFKKKKQEFFRENFKSDTIVHRQPVQRVQDWCDVLMFLVAVKSLAAALCINCKWDRIDSSPALKLKKHVLLFLMFIDLTVFKSRSWKKQDLTTVFICLSKLKPSSKITPQIFYPRLHRKAWFTKIYCWCPRRIWLAELNYFSFTLIKIYKVRRQPGFHIRQARYKSLQPTSTRFKGQVNLSYTRIWDILETYWHVCWRKFELNSAGHRSSRTEFWHPWL